MPSFTGDHRHETVLWIFQLGDCKVDDLLLDGLAFFVTSVEMIGKPARFIGVACVKELNHRTRRIHSAGGINSWAESKSDIVCCHALAISATGNVDQSAQTSVRDVGEVL